MACFSPVGFTWMKNYGTRLVMMMIRKLARNDLFRPCASFFLAVDSAL
jgi:hypothetical protein